MKEKKIKEERAISLYDEDGNIRSKEDFLKDFEDVYEEAAAAAEHQDDHCECCGDFSVIDAFVDPESQIDPELVLTTHEFATRCIYLNVEINPQFGLEVIRRIRFWNSVDDLDGIPAEMRMPIQLYIDTPGGDIQTTFNIISAIKMSKTPIHTITYGCGYSGGFFIGICGHKRFGFSNSSYLFHEGMTIDGGDAHKFLQHADYYKFQLKKIKEITLTNTKITSEEYDEHRKDDWFLSPSEAIHYGVIDEIISEF